MGLRTLMHLTVSAGIPLSFDARKHCKIVAAVSRLLALANATIIISTIITSIVIAITTTIIIFTSSIVTATITPIITITIEVAGAGC